MRRREFIRLLGGATATWGFAVHAPQRVNVPTIRFLCSESPSQFAHRICALHQGLSETGYVEGQNVAIDSHWAEARYERLPALVADLVHRQVAVIAANPAAAALAAKASTSTIAIFTLIGGDPVMLSLSPA